MLNIKSTKNEELKPFPYKTFILIMFIFNHKACPNNKTKA